MKRDVNIYVKRLVPHAKLPQRGYHADAGWDLFTLEETVIPPGASAVVKTGVAVSVPEGWFIHLLGRSSNLNKGIFVIPAIIDAGFRGELFYMATNMTSELISIMAEDRLAQILVLPVPDVYWHEVDHLVPSERGTRGFGSTGR